MISSLLLENKSIFIRILFMCMAALLYGILGASWRSTDPCQQDAAGVLRVQLKKQPPILDPARTVDLDGARIASRLYNGLVMFDDTLLPVPDLAASWHIAEDGRTYIFFLKRGILFHSGRKLTADDVLYSFERLLKPQTCSPCTWVFSRSAGAEEFLKGRATSMPGLQKRGASEVVIQLSEPFAPFFYFLGLTVASIIPRPQGQNHVEDGTFQVCTTRPFMLNQWRHSQYLLLEQNRTYHGGPPSIKWLKYEVIPEDFTALMAFETGDIEVLLEIMAANYDRLSRDSLRRACMIVQQPLNIYYLGLNCQKEPFTDVRVQQALYHALDKEKVFKTPGRG